MFNKTALHSVHSDISFAFHWHSVDLEETCYSNNDISLKLCKAVNMSSKYKLTSYYLYIAFGKKQQEKKSELDRSVHLCQPLNNLDTRFQYLSTCRQGYKNTCRHKIACQTRALRSIFSLHLLICLSRQAGWKLKFIAVSVRMSSFLSFSIFFIVFWFLKYYLNG